jgi:hypothetical protein
VARGRHHTVLQGSIGTTWMGVAWNRPRESRRGEEELVRFADGVSPDLAPSNVVEADTMRAYDRGRRSHVPSPAYHHERHARGADLREGIHPLERDRGGRSDAP